MESRPLGKRPDAELDEMGLSLIRSAGWEVRIRKARLIIEKEGA